MTAWGPWPVVGEVQHAAGVHGQPRQEMKDPVAQFPGRPRRRWTGQVCQGGGPGNRVVTIAAALIQPVVDRPVSGCG